MVKRTMTTNKLERMVDKYSRLLPEWQMDVRRLQESEMTAHHAFKLGAVVTLMEMIVEDARNDIEEARKAQATAAVKRATFAGMYRA